MASDPFEEAVQALLEGRPLPFTGDAATDRDAEGAEPLRIVDAIARAHRIVVFGTDVSLDSPASTHWGHLETRGEIGRGASGTVYRAWDTKLAREVALKLLAPEAGPASLEEGRRLARLNHPHIVTVFGADSHDGTAGIWMELLEGDTLDEILARDSVFGPEEALLIGLDLAGALSAVHSAGLLHRDVKARNVVRERGGRVVLMDLGAGRAADTPPEGGDGTGTPMYMAPEVLAGGAATVQSDIYSLGVLLYRLLTRTFPVTGKTLDQLRAAHADNLRIPLATARSDLNVEIVSPIERACHPDPAARYASAADFEAALAAAFQHALAQRAFVASPISRALARWRKPLLAATTAIAVLFLTIWGGWDTPPGRAGRRAIGLAVPPRSPLYIVISGGIGIVRAGQLTLVPYNPARAGVMAVSSDLGIRTMAALPRFTSGGGFRLDGSPVTAPRAAPSRICCFGDGTTDGRFNYAVYQDSTLLAPIGSRPLAPPAIYKFDRDWSHPRVLFPLAPEGAYYGMSYSAATDSFWLTKQIGDTAVVEHWSRDGERLAAPIRLASATFLNIAFDPADGTLWAVRLSSNPSVIRLENFTQSGRALGAFNVDAPEINTGVAGAEFNLVHRP